VSIRQSDNTPFFEHVACCNAPSLLIGYAVLSISATMGISDFHNGNLSFRLRLWIDLESPTPPLRISQVRMFPSLCTPSLLTPSSPSRASYRCFRLGSRFRHIRQLDHYHCVTRLHRVHLRYGLHRRVSQTRCVSLPPHTLRQLHRERQIAMHGPFIR
jgi:hypothetical protein